MNTRPSYLINRVIALFEQIPYSLIAFLARFSIAAVFWKSGQTKVEGFAIDLISGTFQLGEPKLAASTLPLFRSEYHVPVIARSRSAYGRICRALFPGIDPGGLCHTLLGLGLIGMTLVIQLFVYPDAYPTHGTWIALLLLLVAKGRDVCPSIT